MPRPSRQGPALAIALVLLAIITIPAALVYLSPRPEHLDTTAELLPAPSTAATAAAQLPGTIHWRPAARVRQFTLLDKHWFTIGYDERTKSPAWVLYQLAGPITHPGPEPTRPATFATDFATAAHVSHRDYSGSGFDRGHMCPAYAMWSRGGADAFMATFICSNIIPQPHQVNAGIWEELETDIAGRWSSHGGQPSGGGWAERFGEATVINGPIYSGMPRTLRNGTTIPVTDFSVVIRHDGGHYQALAFEIPNVGDPRGPLDRYIVTIKQVEDDSGLDLFAGEADTLRAEMENAHASALWH